MVSVLILALLWAWLYATVCHAACTARIADADLRVTWEEGVCALEHPVHGLVGPVPFRRTGDHMGARGFVNFAGPNVAPGDGGLGTVLDLAPTIASLASGTALPALSGRDLLADR